MNMYVIERGKDPSLWARAVRYSESSPVPSKNTEGLRSHSEWQAVNWVS
jgi:hypothetical protein